MQLFVSHTWTDKAIIKKLVNLPDFVNVWIDDTSMTAGEELDHSVKMAIRDSHIFLVAISRVSITKEWIRKELSWALQCEKELGGRTFIFPVILETDTEAFSNNPPFSSLENRLFIDASDQSESGVLRSRDKIQEYLFKWSCDRLEDYEPVGSTDRRYIEKIEKDLVGFQDHVYKLKATLSCPLHTLVGTDARKFLRQARSDYNEFTEYFIQELTTMDDTMRWRFKGAHKSFQKLADFIRDDVYRGAAFSLNDILELMNSYDAALRDDSDAYNTAEKLRKKRIDELENIMDTLSMRVEYFLDAVKG